MVSARHRRHFNPSREEGPDPGRKARHSRNFNPSREGSSPDSRNLNNQRIQYERQSRQMLEWLKVLWGEAEDKDVEDEIERLDLELEDQGSLDRFSDPRKLESAKKSMKRQAEVLKSRVQETYFDEDLDLREEDQFYDLESPYEIMEELGARDLSYEADIGGKELEGEVESVEELRSEVPGTADPNMRDYEVGFEDGQVYVEVNILGRSGAEGSWIRVEAPLDGISPDSRVYEPSE